jgi:hypothetical protein
VVSDQWIVDTYPAVPPNEKFRQDLQRALEQTHRQQAAQRKLGTQGRRKTSPQVRQVAAFAAVVIAILFVLRLLRARQADARGQR